MKKPKLEDFYDVNDPRGLSTSEYNDFIKAEIAYENHLKNNKMYIMTTNEIITELEDFRIWQEDKPQYDLYPQSDRLKIALELAIKKLES